MILHTVLCVHAEKTTCEMTVQLARGSTTGRQKLTVFTDNVEVRYSLPLVISHCLIMENWALMSRGLVNVENWWVVALYHTLLCWTQWAACCKLWYDYLFHIIYFQFQRLKIMAPRAIYGTSIYFVWPSKWRKDF